MRSDIAHALQALDGKTRYLMTSVAANRHFKKSLAGLAEVVGEQSVIALAPAVPTIIEAARTGAGLGGQRLMVLTDRSVFEVNASSRLTFSGLESIETPLAEIVDVTTRTERLAIHAGLRKTRFLVIERRRSGGGTKRTELDVLTDQSFASFSAALADQLQTVRAQLATAQASRDVPSPPPAAPLSLADEIGKLAALRDQGALTPDEFAAMKAKLLA